MGRHSTSIDPQNQPFFSETAVIYLYTELVMVGTVLAVLTHKTTFFSLKQQSSVFFFHGIDPKYVHVELTYARRATGRRLSRVFVAEIIWVCNKTNITLVF